MTEYWTICAEAALDEAGIEATEEQIATIAGQMEAAHDAYGEQHGHIEADKGLWSDLTRRAETAERRAREEEEKVPCPECAGKVIPGLSGTTRPASDECWYCGETGKVEPGRAKV